MITANIPNIIWKADVDASINHSWDKFFSYVLPDYLPAIREKISEGCYNPGKTITFEYELQKANGECIWLLSSGRAYVNETCMRLYGFTTDITQRKDAEKQLIAAKEKAEESDRLKSTFLATMSHELRTPLNAIIGFSSLINDEKNIDELVAYASIVHQSGDHLLSIIDSIFEISILQSKKISIMESKFPVKELIRSINHYLSVEISKKNKTHLKTSFIPDTRFPNPQLQSDKIRITQLLSNLLDNAIKYTEKGRIEYGYLVENNEIVFFVRDTGIGIPAGKTDIIFDQFRQGDEQSGINLGGVGLGLAICKEIANLLNGKLWVESTPGIGSTFYFKLNMVITTEPVSPARPDPAFHQPPDLSDFTILIIDDVDENIILLCSYFSGTNANILTATNGNEAVSLVLNHPEISLVLMDIKMHGMDGYEATREIHKIRAGLPVIAQTAYALIGDSEKALEAGCIDYIAKPISRAALLNKVTAIL
ncbi:MAG: ATP-binding protein [Bacteroidetes bacterium]|nr:ATP-binding protein [Bacteroidota bacterium]